MVNLFEEDQMLSSLSTPLSSPLFENEDGLYEDEDVNLFVLLNEARIGRLGRPGRKRPTLASTSLSAHRGGRIR